MNFNFLIACWRGDLQTVQCYIAEVSDDDRTLGLTNAARNGCVEVVQWLIEHGGCDVNARDSEALFGAIEKGHFDVVKVLVEHGVNTNARKSNYFELPRPLLPLLVAAERGDEKISRLLIKNGADVDGKNYRGQTAVFLTHRLAIVEILVDGGANVNVQDDKGRTPLMIHIEKGNEDIVSYLVAHGADVDRKDPAGQTALHLTGHLIIVKVLVDGGANVNVQDDKGRTPLMIHIEKGNEDIVSYLVAHGADVDRKDTAGQTALCRTGHLTIVQILVDGGANVNVQDKYGRTPLMIHAENGNKDIVSYLVAHGADVHRKDSHGRTALHYPCHRAHIQDVSRPTSNVKCEIVKLLVGHGSNIEERDCHQSTPLVHAALRGDQILAWQLIKCRADVKQLGMTKEQFESHCDESKETGLQRIGFTYSNLRQCKEAFLMRAAFNGYTEIVKTLILACSVDVNCKDKSTGDTPLHKAARGNRVQCGILLAEAGSSTEIRNNSSQKPLDLASSSFVEAIQQTVSFTARKTVCIIGNACSGKSTIIASLQNENAPFYKKIVHWVRGVDDISQRTAGIDPVLIESENYGNTIFFDFAGQNEYHGPHEMFLQSILSKSRSTVTIIVVVKVTEEEAVISQQLHRWLYPLSTMSVTASNPIRVIIIGSFLDKVKHTQVAIDKVNRCCSELEHSLSDVPINIEGQCFFNCRRPYSSDFARLRVYLRDVPIPEFRALDTPYSICWVISHMKDLTERKSIRLSVFEEWIEENRANLPVNMPSVEEVCKDLSSTGHFLYIPNKDVKNGWLVLDLPAILHEVYGKLYSPSQRTANEFGLLNCRELVNLFPDFDKTMIRDVLIAMEFCIDIDPKFFREEVVKLLPDHEQGHDFLFFPSLISSDVAYVDIFVSSPSSEIHHTLCWHLQAHKQHLITPRLLQTILLHLAVRHVRFPTSEITDPLCSVWSKGIFWQTPGMEVAVQVSDTHVIQVIGRSYANTPPDKLINRLSTVVCDIGDTVRQLSPKLKFTTFLIHGVSPRQLLEKPSSPTPHQTYPLKMILESIREGETMCLSLKGRELVAASMEIAQLFCGLIPSKDIVQQFYLEGYSPFATNAQPTTIDPTTGPTQPTTIDPTTGPTQPTTIDPTTGPTQPTTIDPTTGPTQPTTIDPTTGPTQPTTIDPTTGPTQPTTIDPTTGPTQPTTIDPTTGPTQPTTIDPTTGPTQLTTIDPTTGLTQPTTIDPTTGPTQPTTIDPTTGPTQPTTIDPTTGPTQPTTIDPTTGPTQPTTIDPTTGPTQPTTIDPNISADQVKKVLCTAGYSELRSLISYNDYVQDELYMNRSLISREVDENIESKPTRSEKTKYLLKHVLNNSDLDWLKELAAVLENDPGNRQNQEAGRMLMVAIGETMDPPTTEHCPDDPILTTPTIEDLTRLVVPRILGSDWYSIGCQLGMEPSILKAIEPDNPLTGSTSTCRDVFSLWLSGVRGTGESPRIWKTVLIAIKDAGYPSIAEDVRRSLSSNSPHP